MIKKLRKQLSKRVLENELMSKYTTFKIGGPARYFFKARNNKEIIKAVKTAEKLKLSFFILGGGSNLLVSDKGFMGLVIKMENQKIKIKGNKMEVEGGAVLSEAVVQSIKRGLTGLEWAMGIPGKTGGAVCGNAGAFGHAIEETVERVEVLEKGRIKKYKKKECNFKYRESIFKKKNCVILKIVFNLKKDKKKQGQELIKEYLNCRKDKHPSFPSAGSVFKNIMLNQEIIDSLQEKGINLSEEFLKRKTIPAGWLIDRLDLKEKKIGKAMISSKHANFVINAGKAKAADIITLIGLIKMKARHRFNLQLEEEIQYLGF